MIIKKPAKPTNKAIAYIRVSSQRQVDEGVSISSQDRNIKNYVLFKTLSLAEEDILIEEMTTIFFFKNYTSFIPS